MSKFKLYSYQQEALEVIQAEFKNNVFKQLVVLPTGSGKTFLMAAVAKHFNKKVLIIAHREELIQQAYKKIKLFWRKADIGICKAKKNELNHQIVLGSVQTCVSPKRLVQLKKENFEILMIDEAHHSTAKTYQKIINELGFSGDNKKLLVGLTATPMRSDKKNLGDLFDKIVYSKTISEFIESKFLCPITGRRILTSFNLNGVKSKMGDFAVGELATAVNSKERNQFVFEKFQEYSSGRKALIFCADVKHCHDLAQLFNENGIKAKAAWGNMKKDDRKKVLKNFASGKTQVVMSCGILTEGFDEPSIQTVVMARPTKSKGFYIQMIGRGLRKHPKKEFCLILDFTDVYHNLNSIISLKKTIPSAKVIIDQTNNTGHGELRINTLEDIDEEFDILGNYTKLPINFIWIPIGDNEFSLADDDRNEIVIQPLKDKFIAEIFYRNNETQSIVSNPKTFEQCLKACERFAEKNLNVTFSDLSSPWLKTAKNQKPTSTQIKILKENKAFNNKINKLKAFLQIKTIFALRAKKKRLQGNNITARQKYILRLSGVPSNNTTKKEASDLILRLKTFEDKYGFKYLN